MRLPTFGFLCFFLEEERRWLTIEALTFSKWERITESSLKRSKRRRKEIEASAAKERFQEVSQPQWPPVGVRPNIMYGLRLGRFRGIVEGVRRGSSRAWRFSRGMDTSSRSVVMCVGVLISLVLPPSVASTFVVSSLTSQRANSSHVSLGV